MQYGILRISPRTANTDRETRARANEFENIEEQDGVFLAETY